MVKRSISFESDEMKAFRCGFTTAGSNTAEARDRVPMHGRVSGHLFEDGLLKCGVSAAKPTGNHITLAGINWRINLRFITFPMNRSTVCLPRGGNCFPSPPAKS